MDAEALAVRQGEQHDVLAVYAIAGEHPFTAEGDQRFHITCVARQLPPAVQGDQEISGEMRHQGGTLRGREFLTVRPDGLVERTAVARPQMVPQQLIGTRLPTGSFGCRRIRRIRRADHDHPRLKPRTAHPRVSSTLRPVFTIAKKPSDR
ncbi:hypothetical protein [Streptomyces sp. NPDC058579]|uniref:hypothetical protein n=1 Tax=Streptomyces sp. NPDC058579 TaxID=3346548 RepID=UPI0036661F31